MSGVGLKEIQQQVGHFGADLPQNWTADVAVVATGSTGAVAAEAGGENVRKLRKRGGERVDPGPN